MKADKSRNLSIYIWDDFKLQNIETRATYISCVFESCAYDSEQMELTSHCRWSFADRAARYLLNWIALTCTMSFGWVVQTYAMFLNSLRKKEKVLTTYPISPYRWMFQICVKHSSYFNARKKKETRRTQCLDKDIWFRKGLRTDCLHWW